MNTDIDNRSISCPCYRALFDSCTVFEQDWLSEQVIGNPYTLFIPVQKFDWNNALTVGDVDASDLGLGPDLWPGADRAITVVNVETYRIVRFDRLVKWTGRYLTRKTTLNSDLEITIFND